MKTSNFFRNLNRSDRAGKVLRAVALALVIVFLFLFALSRIQGITMSSFRDSWNNVFSGGKGGDGYPYQLNSSTVQKVDVLNGDIYILFDDRTVTLGGSAKEMRSTKHTYAEPAVTFSGDRALVYDRAGNRYRVENRTELLYEGSTPEDESIITTAIGKKGNIALATLSNGATSRLTVWNSTYDKEEFVWNCADYTITSVALSDNGKYVAVSTLGAKDGDTFSKIYVFDFQYADPVSETEYPGTALFAVNFTENDTVVGVGDNKLTFLKNLKKPVNTDFGTSTLSSFAFSPNGRTILVLDRYGSMNDQLLQCYSGSGRQSFEEHYNVHIQSVYASNSRISVLTGSYVDLYGFSGTRHRAREVGANALLAFTNGRTSYSYEMGTIAKTHRMSSQPVHEPEEEES